MNIQKYILFIHISTFLKYIIIFKLDIYYDKIISFFIFCALLLCNSILKLYLKIYSYSMMKKG